MFQKWTPTFWSKGIIILATKSFYFKNRLIFIGSFIKILTDWKQTFIDMNAKTSKFTPLC